jgi:hypothetical protein
VVLVFVPYGLVMVGVKPFTYCADRRRKLQAAYPAVTLCIAPPQRVSTSSQLRSGNCGERARGVVPAPERVNPLPWHPGDNSD